MFKHQNLTIEKNSDDWLFVDSNNICYSVKMDDVLLDAFKTFLGKLVVACQDGTHLDSEIYYYNNSPVYMGFHSERETDCSDPDVNILIEIGSTLTTLVIPKEKIPQLISDIDNDLEPVSFEEAKQLLSSYQD